MPSTISKGSGLRMIGEGLITALLNFQKSRTIKGLRIALKVATACTAIILFLWSFQFPIFFLEEADQKLCFAAFNATSSEQWGLVMEICQNLEIIRNKANKWINAIGWAHPVSAEAYRAYFNLATPLYIRSLQAAAAEAGYTNAPAPTIPSGILAGGPLPAYTPEPLAFFGDATAPPEIPGAIMYTEAGRWAGTKQEVTIIVPIVQFTRRTTSAGNAMGDASSDQNFKLISYAESVINRMDQLRGHWVAVCGEVIKWQQYNEIIVSSWSQIIEIKPLSESPPA